LGVGVWITLSLVSLFAIYILGVFIVFGIFDKIFDTALYVYSETGHIVEGYSEEIMTGAFRKKRKPSAN